VIVVCRSATGQIEREVALPGSDVSTWVRLQGIGELGGVVFEGASCGARLMAGGIGVLLPFVNR